jgi:signal peptidase
MHATQHPYASSNTLFLIAEEPRIPSRRRALGVASSALLACAVLLVLVAVAGMILGAWRFTVIDTGSMRPTLNPGDVAVLRSERTADLRTGQIVAFHPPAEPRLTVVHRVVWIQRRNGETVIQTKGDSNNVKDQWRAHLIGSTVWREALKVPELGYLAVWSGQRPVRLAALIAIVLLVVSILMGWIWRPAGGRVQTRSDDPPRERSRERRVVSP